MKKIILLFISLSLFTKAQVNTDQLIIEDINQLRDSLENRYRYLEAQDTITKDNIEELKEIKRGVIWNLSINSGNIDTVINDILNTNILFNPLSHECYKIN